MDPVYFMIDYFNLGMHLTKENLVSAIYLLYFYAAMDGGVGVIG